MFASKNKDCDVIPRVTFHVLTLCSNVTSQTLFLWSRHNFNLVLRRAPFVYIATIYSCASALRENRRTVVFRVHAVCNQTTERGRSSATRCLCVAAIALALQWPDNRKLAVPCRFKVTTKQKKLTVYSRTMWSPTAQERQGVDGYTYWACSRYFATNEIQALAGKSVGKRITRRDDKKPHSAFLKLSIDHIEAETANHYI